MAYGLGHSPAPRELTFTQGFVAGQLVLILLLAFLFRYFFMTNVPASLEKQRADLIARTETMQKSLDARCKAQKQGRAVPYDQSLEARILDMLQRTHYDMSAHPPESVDWLTLLAAQIIYGYRESILQAAQHIHDPNQGMPLPSLQTPEKAATKRVLERALNGAVGGHTMGLLDTITVTDINFGSQYPTFSNARFRPSDKPNGLRLEVDFDYVDTISIGLDTKLLLNFPRLRFGSLALALTLRIERFAGTAAVEVGPRGGQLGAPQELRLCLFPDFILRARVASVMGSEKGLKNVPKIEELLVSRLHIILQDKVVWPKYWSIPLRGLSQS